MYDTKSVINHIAKLYDADIDTFWKYYGVDNAFINYNDMKLQYEKGNFNYQKKSMKYWFNNFVYYSSIYVYDRIYKNDIVNNQKEKQANVIAEKTKIDFIKTYTIKD